MLNICLMICISCFRLIDSSVLVLMFSSMFVVLIILFCMMNVVRMLCGVVFSVCRMVMFGCFFFIIMISVVMMLKVVMVMIMDRIMNSIDLVDCMEWKKFVWLWV